MEQESDFPEVFCGHLVSLASGSAAWSGRLIPMAAVPDIEDRMGCYGGWIYALTFPESRKVKFGRAWGETSTKRLRNYATGYRPGGARGDFGIAALVPCSRPAEDELAVLQAVRSWHPRGSLGHGNSEVFDEDPATWMIMALRIRMVLALSGSPVTVFPTDACWEEWMGEETQDMEAAS